MNASSENLTGGCMCGAVRYEVTGPPKAVFHCHCESCRSHTGAPVATLAVLTADQVSFSGTARKGYGSAPGVVRAFCPECGTPLTWETDHPHWGLLCSLHISTFDAPDGLAPSAHSFYGERIAWMDVSDDLPRYEGFVSGGVLISHGPLGKT